ncbi:MAG: hypothetical protein A4E45_01213 [Methanosaeta sp. PtaB.Bin039]|nr:MAG: hypothetical protein A4E45_01213 [Methanosaeta sp. PtaB.Bin039]HOT07122.1 hypothetical protein [Methanotrichaceae archaeon]HQF17066.1 hypothetical protein [Methanotrichaceae archaeon]HQI91687.1 hypothetical protein [Methanotrichaceae archaeon]HQJ29066.1 hypothetical protein [Methanotrichaceae archaeon]
MRYHLWMLLLVMASVASAYPFSGDNGQLNCTVFDSFKAPFTTGDINYPKNVMLCLDTGLRYPNGSYADMSGVRYNLVDRNDRVYDLNSRLSRDVQTGRRILVFVVPKEALPKRLMADPRASPEGGQLFSVELGDLANVSDQNLTLLYYGIAGSRFEPLTKSITLEVGVINRDNSVLPVFASNFTMVDQWNWSYGGSGFTSRQLQFNESLRTGVDFVPVSPYSRPVRLIYDNLGQPMVIEIDQGCLAVAAGTNEAASGPACCSKKSAAEENPNSVKAKVAAAKERLSQVRSDQNLTSG